MKRRLRILLLAGVFSITNLSMTPLLNVYAEEETEKSVSVTEAPTEATEPVTEAPTEAAAPVTEAPTEAEAPVTEASTEAPVTEVPETELSTEVSTEEETEKISEVITEPETEKPTESITESETEKQSEVSTETQKIVESEKETEAKSSKEIAATYESIAKEPIYVNGNYPAADITENTIQIYEYLTKVMGLNHAGACGILANIQCESNFITTAVGDGGSSYGLCQWHLGRFSALISFCNANGYDFHTLSGQMAYLEYELNTGYTNVLNYVTNVSDTAQGAYDAAYYWCMYFEMPSHTLYNSQMRGDLARNEYFTKTFKSVEKETKHIKKAQIPETFTVEEIFESAEATEISTGLIPALSDVEIFGNINFTLHEM